MICKNCQQEMPDEAKVCPHCGTAAEETVPAPQQENKTEKKLWRTIILLAAGCVILLGLLTCAILYGTGVFKSDDVEATQEPTQVQDATENVTPIYSVPYTADTAAAVENKDQVVATMGDKELTNGELQLYFQNSIYTVYYDYYYYLSFLGLDLSAPLNEQVCGLAADITWEEYFVEEALANWQSYTLVEILVENENFQVSDDLQASLDGIKAELEAYATAGGYESLDAYLYEGVGVNVSLDDYLHFNEAYYIASEYLESYYHKAYPTADQIEAYYTENEATFLENGVTRDLGLNSSVRHILVAVEGGTTNEDGTVTYSEEEWHTALVEAERILQEWKDGDATEESFAELAVAYTDDTGSISTGGLYENVNVDASYVASFENWAIDPAREPGQTEIVKTEYGYHIMYFVEGEDYWSSLVAEEVVADAIQEVLLAAKEQYPAEVNYENICLAKPVFG